jgi:hypothetical protein
MMSNPNAPYGLAPVRHYNGSPWNGQVALKYIGSADNNAYAIGDIVLSDNTGDARGVPGVVKAANSDVARGVIVFIGTQQNGLPAAFDPNNLSTVKIPATKAQNYYVWVVEDPTVIFKARADAGTLPVTKMSGNISYTVANPSGISAVSGTVLTTASVNSTDTLPLKLHGAVLTPDNDITSNYAEFYVSFNTHELHGKTAGVVA